MIKYLCRALSWWCGVGFVRAVSCLSLVTFSLSLLTFLWHVCRVLRRGGATTKSPCLFLFFHVFSCFLFFLVLFCLFVRSFFLAFFFIFFLFFFFPVGGRCCSVNHVTFEVCTATATLPYVLRSFLSCFRLFPISSVISFRSHVLGSKARHVYISLSR